MTTSDATNVQIPDEFDDDTDFWPHKICNMYEANRNGVVRHIKTRNHVGYKEKDGYFRFGCNSECCRGNRKNKKYRLHRFVYECFNGLIEDGYVIDHIDNDPSNNRLENLQKITQSENIKKDYGEGRCLPPISVKATNISTGQTYIYKSIYGASKDLNINTANICKVLNGLRNTSLSKKYNERYTFEKLDKTIKYSDIQKVKIKINIDTIKSKIANINRC